jgi:hypothetical protein
MANLIRASVAPHCRRRGKMSEPAKNLPAPIDWSRELVKEIAADIGKEVAHHIETMYPNAVKATSRNMLLSVRGCVQNEIMAALGTMDEQAIRERLTKRKQFRRKIKAAYQNNRAV